MVARLPCTIAVSTAWLVCGHLSPPGSLLAYGPAQDTELLYCLSIEGNRIGNGVKVHLGLCDETWHSPGQLFQIDEGRISGRIRMQRDPGYCVVVDGDRFEDGQGVQLWPCDENNDNQLWSLDGIPFSGAIRASGARGDMCLAVDGNEASNGARVQVRSCAGGRGSQPWVQLVLNAVTRAVYAVPNEDRACEAPFEPVSQSKEACAAAAEVLRPGKGCYKNSWAQIVSRDDRPAWPEGCYFYGACQGGCGLFFNPSGTGGSCPMQGDCMSIDLICQLAPRPFLV